jgi:hypothetical protein
MAARKETVVDLAKFIDKGVHVKLSGGREGALPCARCACACVLAAGAVLAAVLAQPRACAGESSAASAVRAAAAAAAAHTKPTAAATSVP